MRSMQDIMGYHQSIGYQIKSLQNQVRNLIGSANWGEEGRFKEAVIRKILRDRIGPAYHVGTGFVLDKNGPTTQIDILITKNASPVLFQDGDFKIVTPDAVAAIIEVKTGQTRSTLPTTLEKLSDVAKIVRDSTNQSCMTGLFVFDEKDLCENAFFDSFPEQLLQDKCEINWVCLGVNLFIRYWNAGDIINVDGLSKTITTHQYRLYNLPNLAYSYFISNAVLDTNNSTDFKFQNIWFPLDNGKESYFSMGISANGYSVDRDGQEILQ